MDGVRPRVGRNLNWLERTDIRVFHFHSLLQLPSSVRMIAGAAALTIAATAVPAQAQFSAGYKFLESVKKADGNAVVDALSDPSSTLVNTRDLSSGETALHMTVARRDTTWTKFLLEKGANPNIADKKGVMPLQIAVSLNFKDGVEALLDNGANPNSTNATGETPLITATLMQNVGLARLLLDKGADPDRADRSGRSARDYAKQGERNPVLALIENADANGAGDQYGPVQF